MVINYESEISTQIMNSLKNKYNICSNNIMYRYIILKFELLKIINTNDNIKDLIFSELNITKNEYRQCKLLNYGECNNFNNILDDWEYMYRTNEIINENGVINSFKEYINLNLANIIKYANKEAYFIRLNKRYKEINAYFRLKKLNELFNIENINEIDKIDGFSQEYKLSIENELDRYYHAINFNTKLLKTINEEDFEDYVIGHLNDIEDGLTYISRQYEIQDARIDILAKDKNNTFVIIELKIANDKHLIWQSIYYPIALSEKIKNNKFRMMTICPEYPDYIKIPLTQIDGIELISYTALISNKKIINVTFKKERI